MVELFHFDFFFVDSVLVLAVSAGDLKDAFEVPSTVSQTYIVNFV